jgi:hypothetical protein
MKIFLEFFFIICKNRCKNIFLWITTHNFFKKIFKRKWNDICVNVFGIHVRPLKRRYKAQPSCRLRSQTGMVQCWRHADWNRMTVPCQGWKNIPCVRNTNSPPDFASPVQAPTRFTIVVSIWSLTIFLFFSKSLKCSEQTHATKNTNPQRTMKSLNWTSRCRCVVCNGSFLWLPLP